MSHTARYLANKLRRKIEFKEQRKAAGMPEDLEEPITKKPKLITPTPSQEEVEALRDKGIMVLVNQINQGTEQIYKDIYGDQWEDGLKYEQGKLLVRPLTTLSISSTFDQAPGHGVNWRDSRCLCRGKVEIAKMQMLIPDSHRKRKRTARDGDLNSRLASEEDMSKTGFLLDIQVCIWMTMIPGINGVLGWLSVAADERALLENCIVKSGLDVAGAHGLKRSWLDLALESSGRPLYTKVRSSQSNLATRIGGPKVPRAPVTMAAYAGHHYRSNLRGKLHILPSDLQRYL